MLRVCQQSPFPDITGANTRAQLNDARRQQNEKEHEDLMQTAWKNLCKKWDEEDAVKGRSRWLKPEPKSAIKSEEKYESFQEEDAWQEVIENEKEAGPVKKEVKQESDNIFFKKEKGAGPSLHGDHQEGPEGIEGVRV